LLRGPATSQLARAWLASKNRVHFCAGLSSMASENTAEAPMEASCLVPPKPHNDEKSTGFTLRESCKARPERPQMNPPKLLPPAALRMTINLPYERKQPPGSCAKHQENIWVLRGCHEQLALPTMRQPN
jgi:hypothetical protein